MSVFMIQHCKLHILNGRRWLEKDELDEEQIRLERIQRLVHPMPQKYEISECGVVEEEAPNRNRQNLQHFPTLLEPCRITQDSNSLSRPSTPLTIPSRPSLRSSATSTSILSVETPPDQDSRKRPSVLRRLRSSFCTFSHQPSRDRVASISPADFRLLPEEPEMRFTDSIGMVIPGVCDRKQCTQINAHFITAWRLCEPIEYTTAMADHGITYTDYSRLVAVLANFLDEPFSEPNWRYRPKRPFQSSTKSRDEGQRYQDGSVVRLSIPTRDCVPYVSNQVEQHNKAEEQGTALNKLLEEITWNWQERGLQVMVCLSSYSLFAPNRVSESHIQLLHVPLKSPSTSQMAESEAISEQRLYFIDPFAAMKSDESNLLPHDDSTHHHKQTNQSDRAQPWSLWPNAIPFFKQELVCRNAERYGSDPYFRAWMRASITSRTQTTSYATWMIEREDNPLVNTRREYTALPSGRSMLWGMLTKGHRWTEQFQGPTNRASYEHNRKLECRKATEHGSRLRILRFGFRHPMYPPHTPEMDEIGLTRETYCNIISKIEEIRAAFYAGAQSRIPHISSSWSKLRRRSRDDALTKLSQYIRQLNTAQRKVVWTIEVIPGVYDEDFGKDKREWEISAWDGKDPLELLIQLENWGIIEKKLDIENDD